MGLFRKSTFSLRKVCALTILSLHMSVIVTEYLWNICMSIMGTGDYSLMICSLYTWNSDLPTSCLLILPTAHSSSDWFIAPSSLAPFFNLQDSVVRLHQLIQEKVRDRMKVGVRMRPCKQDCFGQEILEPSHTLCSFITPLWDTSSLK